MREHSKGSKNSLDHYTGSVKQALEAFQLPWDQGQNNSETPTSLKDIEIKHIQETLDKTGGSRRKTAKLLGISEAALYAKIKRF
ncbi:helix-turn-helix domain-containing protein, partial [Acidobacteriota bacterium]